MIEKPKENEAPYNIAIIGRYIITPRIFDILKNANTGKDVEIQLTDALKTLISEEDMYAYDFESRRYNVGDKEGFLEETVEFALQRDDLKETFMNYLLTVKDNDKFKGIYNKCNENQG